MIRAIVATMMLLVANDVQDERTWTDSSGKFKIVAEFVSHEDGVVRLKKSDNTILSLNIDRLSEPDQQFIQSLTRLSRAEQAAILKSIDAAIAKRLDDADNAFFHQKRALATMRKYVEDGLTSLDLRIGQLTELPDEIWLLKNQTELGLWNNKLTTLSAEVGKLSYLTVLSVGNNQLEKLPPEIGQLKRLTELYLDDNHLTSLPPEIWQLTSLEKLYLAKNHLTKLPPEIGKLTNLKSLIIYDNQFTVLPPEIGQLTRLTELTASNMGLTKVPPEIGKLASLQKLYLDDNKFTELPPEIGQLSELTYLSLIRSSISNNDLKHLSSLKKLKTLDLRESNGITQQGVAALRKALPDCDIKSGGF